MLDGVNLRRIHDWLIVGACHADIKGGDDLIVHAILAGHIDAREQFQMVDGEACNFIHENTSKSVSFIPIIRK